VPDHLLYGRELTLLLIAYTCGCFATGYYWVRWTTGRDLRQIGSGNCGAKNAGRILGLKGYVVTAIGDVLKGWAAVSLAAFFGLDGWWLAAAAIAVVIGHNWPIQLGFRGGKGVATTYGAILAIAPMVGFSLWLVFLPLRALIFRSTTLAGLFTFAIAPLIAWGLDHQFWRIVLLIILSSMLWLTHWRNLLEEWQQWRQRQTASPPAS
jgi:glycerol-3-phosphate acyltransferase PlsY